MPSLLPLPKKPRLMFCMRDKSHLCPGQWAWIRPAYSQHWHPSSNHLSFGWASTVRLGGLEMNKYSVIRLKRLSGEWLISYKYLIQSRSKCQSSWGGAFSCPSKCGHKDACVCLPVIWASNLLWIIWVHTRSMLIFLVSFPWDLSCLDLVNITYQCEDKPLNCLFSYKTLPHYKIFPVLLVYWFFLCKF